MPEFVAQHREVKFVETYPSEPYACANCKRPREEYETGWQLRYKSYKVDADDDGQHVIVEHREYYYLCPVCSAMEPRKSAWRRFLRALVRDEGPPKSYQSPQQRPEDSAPFGRSYRARSSGSSAGAKWSSMVRSRGSPARAS